jgi:hypothetical protein
MVDRIANVIRDMGTLAEPHVDTGESEEILYMRELLQDALAAIGVAIFTCTRCGLQFNEETQDGCKTHSAYYLGGRSDKTPDSVSLSLLFLFLSLFLSLTHTMCVRDVPTARTCNTTCTGTLIVGRWVCCNQPDTDSAGETQMSDGAVAFDQVPSASSSTFAMTRLQASDTYCRPSRVDGRSELRHLHVGTKLKEALLFHLPSGPVVN